MKLLIDNKEVAEENIEKIVHDGNKIVVTLVYHDKKERIVLDNIIHDIELKK